MIHTSGRILSSFLPAEQEAIIAGVNAARDATAAAARRSPEETEAALAAAAAGQLAPPELVGVQSARYEHEGERRQHTWALMDWGEQHRQLGRQQFLAYPRQPDSMTEGEGGEEEEEEEPAWRASQAAFEAEQQRRYALLPAAGLTEPEWGRLEWVAARAREQPGWLQELQQDVQQPAVQQEQQGGDDSSRGFGGGGKKGRRKKGKGKGKPQDSVPASAEAGKEPLEEAEVEAVQEEELFPFTFDWEKQRRRRDAGEILRALLGDNFERAMAQVGLASAGGLLVGWGRSRACVCCMLRATLGLTSAVAPQPAVCACHTRASTCRGATYVLWVPQPMYLSSCCKPSKPRSRPPCSCLRSCLSAAGRVAAAPTQPSSRRTSRRALHGSGAYRLGAGRALLVVCLLRLQLVLEHLFSRPPWSLLPARWHIPRQSRPSQPVQRAAAGCATACAYPWWLGTHAGRRPCVCPPCSGECMTMQVTFTYTIDPETLLVDTCGIVWGAVHGLQLHGGGG